LDRGGEQTNALDVLRSELNAAQVRYGKSNFSEVLALVDKALSQDGPVSVRYELNRLKGQLLKSLCLPERLIPCLLETAELARDDGERYEAWCELTDAYLNANQREDAVTAMLQAERYAALRGNSSERAAQVCSLRLNAGEKGTTVPGGPESGSLQGGNSGASPHIVCPLKTALRSRI
jgi:tetratricopeptide (TPR) repeat protein